MCVYNAVFPKHPLSQPPAKHIRILFRASPEVRLCTRYSYLHLDQRSLPALHSPFARPREEIYIYRTSHPQKTAGTGILQHDHHRSDDSQQASAHPDALRRRRINRRSGRRVGACTPGTGARRLFTRRRRAAGHAHAGARARTCAGDALACLRR